MGVFQRGGGPGGTSASLWDLSGTTILYGADATAANVNTLRLGGADSVTPLNQVLQTSNALAGTAVDTSGANLTVQSGAGTGTGAVSSIVFQTPTVAGAGTGAQTLTTRLTIDSAAANFNVQVRTNNGTETAPAIVSASDTNTGIRWATNQILFTLNGASSTLIAFDGSNSASGQGIGLTSGAVLWWTSSATVPTALSADLRLGRIGADNLRIGDAPSATPAANTLTVGEASRPGTDSDVGGGNGTLQSGLGTGTGTASSLIFQTPTLAGAGSGVQSYATRLTVATAAVTATVQYLAPAGTVALSSYGFSSDAGVGIYNPVANALGLNANSNEQVSIHSGGNAIRLRSVNTIGWISTNAAPSGGTIDTMISRSAAAVVGFYGATVSVGADTVLASDMRRKWSSTTDPDGTADLFLTRPAAATLQLGDAASATPVAQVLRSQGSRGGTDNNIAGGSLTIHSGLGTGNSTGSQLILATPAAVASGTGQQTMTARLTFNDGFAQMAASRFETAMGANVAAANDLTLGLDGNVFTITGNTQINAITTANWQAGSVITLIFTGTPTVKNNTAGGAGTAVILLAGAADFVASAEDTLQLVFNGTNWREVSRTVI